MDLKSKLSEVVGDKYVDDTPEALRILFRGDPHEASGIAGEGRDAV